MQLGLQPAVVHRDHVGSPSRGRDTSNLQRAVSGTRPNPPGLGRVRDRDTERSSTGNSSARRPQPRPP